MKFAQYLKAVELEAPPELQGRFLNYKALKKTLKRCNEAAHAAAGSPPAAAAAGKPPPPGHVPHDMAAGFVRQLEEEVAMVNSTFERVAASTLAQFRRSSAAKRLARQAASATDAAAKALPPALDPWETVDDDGTSSSDGGGSLAGGRPPSFLPFRLVGALLRDRSNTDATGGGRYGGDAGAGPPASRTAGGGGGADFVASYATLGRPAVRGGKRLPPWWVVARKAVERAVGRASRRLSAWRERRRGERGGGGGGGPAPPRPPDKPLARAARTWLAHHRSASAARSLASSRAISARAGWARRYARANTVGLRKIVKKYGKMCGDPDAGRLLQAFWSGDDPRKAASFLTSPLVAELRAVEVLLSHDRCVNCGDDGGKGCGEVTADSEPGVTTNGLSPAPPAPVPAAAAAAAAAADAQPAESFSTPPPPPPQLLSAEAEAEAAAAAARRAAKGKAPALVPQPALRPPPPSDSDDDDGGGIVTLSRRWSAPPVPAASPLQAPAQPDRPTTPIPPPLAAAWAEPAGGTTSAAAAAAIERGVGVVPFCPAEARFEDDDDDDDDDDEDDDDDDGGGDGGHNGGGGAWYAGGGAGGVRSSRLPALSRPGTRGRSPPGGAAGSSPPGALGAGGPPSWRSSSVGPAGGRGGGGPRSADAAALDDMLDVDPVPSACALSTASTDGPAPPSAAVSPHLRCAICLDVLFRPLGLTCGHAFCADCALAAVGQGRAVGTLAARLAALDPDTPCPGCRRPGAFRGAVPMFDTSALARLRHPRQWAERRAEAGARARQLRRALDRRAARQAKKAGGRAVTPFDLLVAPDTEIF